MSAEGGHLITLWVVNVDSLPRKEVKTETTLASTLFGKDITYHGKFFKTVPGERSVFAKWNKILTQLLKEGKIQVDITFDSSRISVNMNTCRPSMLRLLVAWMPFRRVLI